MQADHAAARSDPEPSAPLPSRPHHFATESTGLRVVVLISGGGSNLAALLAAAQPAEYPVHIVAVGADRHSAAGLDLAREAGVPTFVERISDHPDRASWDHALAGVTAGFAPDLVVSAGFLKLVGPAFMARFRGRYVNTHNTLLPAFPGMHGPADALAYGVKITGATLFVVDDGVDTGRSWPRWRCRSSTRTPRKRSPSASNKPNGRSSSNRSR